MSRNVDSCHRCPVEIPVLLQGHSVLVDMLTAVLGAAIARKPHVIALIGQLKTVGILGHATLDPGGGIHLGAVLHQHWVVVTGVNGTVVAVFVGEVRDAEQVQFVAI